MVRFSLTRIFLSKSFIDLWRRSGSQRRIDLNYLFGKLWKSCFEHKLRIPRINGDNLPEYDETRGRRKWNCILNKLRLDDFRRKIYNLILFLLYIIINKKNNNFNVCKKETNDKRKWSCIKLDNKISENTLILIKKKSNINSS